MKGLLKYKPRFNKLVDTLPRWWKLNKGQTYRILNTLIIGLSGRAFSICHTSSSIFVSGKMTAKITTRLLHQEV